MNYGNRRLLILTREQQKEGWQHSKHRPNKQKRIRYTVKQWAKFDLDKQMYLVKLFHITLTDYRTRRESLKYVLDEYPKKIDKGLKVFDKYMKKFDQGMKQFNDGLKPLSKIGPDNKEINKLLGKKV